MAASEVAARFHPGQLVVLESTTSPGDHGGTSPPDVPGEGSRVGEDFFLAFSPERIDPGNPGFKVRDIPKVVGGVIPAPEGRIVAL